MEETNPENTGHWYGSLSLEKHEFLWIKDYLYKHVGIALNDSKQTLVSGRLERRLRYYGFSSYSEYFRLLGKPGFDQETLMAIDLLTTNETYFFREPQHFNFLNSHFSPKHPVHQPLRFWSVACSSGEEAYILAMVIAARTVSDECRWTNSCADIEKILFKRQRRIRGFFPD